MRPKGWFLWPLLFISKCRHQQWNLLLISCYKVYTEQVLYLLGNFSFAFIRNTYSQALSSCSLNNSCGFFLDIYVFLKQTHKISLPSVVWWSALAHQFMTHILSHASPFSRVKLTSTLWTIFQNSNQNSFPGGHSSIFNTVSYKNTVLHFSLTFVVSQGLIREGSVGCSGQASSWVWTMTQETAAASLISTYNLMMLSELRKLKLPLAELTRDWDTNVEWDTNNGMFLY